MRNVQEKNWLCRGFKTQEDWCNNINEKYFEKNHKVCGECSTKFLGNRRFCCMKCTLLSRTIKNENGCWEWQGCKDSYGYGLIRSYDNSKKNIRTHRLSYEIYNGSIPLGMLVCHTCDNVKCCNPDHLWLGTHKDNNEDARKKGRLKGCTDKQIGENSHRAKLTEIQVIEIRSLLLLGKKDTWLSINFGVHIQTIVAIRTRKTWKHI